MELILKHMQNKKYSITIMVVFLLIVGSMIHAQASPFSESVYINLDNTLDGGYQNITVNESWDLLSTTTNGIQIPIDVRYDYEWIEMHIDTPSPEHPRHHCVCAWEDEGVVQEFIDQYQGETLILYCKSGFRSRTAAEILVDHNFQGIIYNMLGGITEWNATGLPTKGNEAPQKPIITGPSWTFKNKIQQFTIHSNDPDFDDVYYYINFSDGSPTLYLGPFTSGEEITVNHSWSEAGTQFIQSQATDVYQKDSEFSFYQIKIGLTKHTYFPLLEFVINYLKFTWLSLIIP